MVLVPTEELWCLANIVDVSRRSVSQGPEVYALAVGELARRDPASMINEREWAMEVQRLWSFHSCSVAPASYDRKHLQAKNLQEPRAKENTGMFFCAGRVRRGRRGL